MKRNVIGTYVWQEQRRAIESISDDVFDLRHSDTLREIARDVGSGSVSAILVSAERMEAPDIRAVASLRIDFPVSEIVAVTTDGELQGVLRLGRAGVSRLVDLRTNAGPGLLRSAFEGARDTFASDAVSVLLNGIQTTPGFVHFLRAAFQTKPVRSRAFATTMGISDNTFATRFFRSKLPSPKLYLAWGRLAWAAHLGQSKVLSSSQIAFRLGSSSPQSFNRFVKTFSGMRPLEFYDSYTGSSWLALMRQELIDPYVATLRTFDPDASPIRHTRKPRLMLVPDMAA